MSLLYYTSDVVLSLDASRCLGCGRCVDVCPHGVFAMQRTGEAAADGRRMPPLRAAIVHRERCMECGACARNCAPQAIVAGSGVGCAAAIINGMLKGTSPDCGCGCGGDGGNCC